MPETLVLRLNNQSVQHHSWMVIDVAGTRIGEVAFGTLNEARVACDQRNLNVLLPSNESFVSHSLLPLKNRQKLAQALPYAFEDQLIGDSENLHFVAGERDEDGAFSVAAIARKKLDEYLDELSQYHLTPQKVLAEDAMVPITTDGCTVLLESNEGILRMSSGDAVSMELSSLVAGLQLAQANLELLADDNEDADADTDSVMPITVFIDDSSKEAGENAIAQIHQQFPQAEFRRLPHGALSKLAVESLNDDQPNFLQGDYGPSRSYQKLFEPWRYVAYAAGLLLVLTVGFKAVELNKMKIQLQAANTAMLQLAKETYPDRSQIPNPVQLFRSQFKNRGGGSEGSVFIDNLLEISHAYSANLNIKRLNYRAGDLDLEIVAPNVQSLDNFTSSIGEKPGWAANLVSTKATGDNVQGRVTVSRSETP